MASYGLGAVLNGKLLATYPEGNMNNHGRMQILNRHGCGKQEATHGSSLIFFGKKPANFSCFLRQESWRHHNRFSVINCSNSQIMAQPKDVELKKSIGETSQLIPSSQVESLVTEICDTSIVEFKLNLGGFQLHVKRDVDGNDSETPPPAAFLPFHAGFSNGIPHQNGSASSSSLAIVKQDSSSSGEIQHAIDANSDEGLFMLPSPTVGLFRRCRTIKGKKTPPSCNEKQQVNEGQVLCCIEQLGTETPIESDVTGEIVKILRYDGEPVGYGDSLISILPSFPGIKKLQLPESDY